MERVGIEREHRVTPPDHLAVPQVHTVELPDRHPPRSCLHFPERRYPHVSAEGYAKKPLPPLVGLRDRGGA
jgi:hypothetical protein